MEAFQAWYDSALEVLRSLRGMGAWLGRYGGRRATTIGEMRRLLSAYQGTHGGGDGRTPATYRVFYAVSEGGG